MSLLNRLRPKWQNSDADVRAEAVRNLDKNDIELLTAVAKQDPDPRVRRLAIRKLDTPRELLDIAKTDEDDGVRQSAAKRAHQLLVQIACDSRDEPESERALALLTTPEDVVTVAWKAHFDKLREQAFDRLEVDSSLADLVLKSKDQAQRQSALERIEDPEVLKTIVVHEDASDLASSALSKITAVPALEWLVEQKTTPKPLKRQATTKLLTLVDASHPLKVSQREAAFAELLEKVERLERDRPSDGESELTAASDAWEGLRAEGSPPAEMATAFEAIRDTLGAHYTEPEVQAEPKPEPEPSPETKPSTRNSASSSDDGPASEPTPISASSSDAGTASDEPTEVERDVLALVERLRSAEPESLQTELDEVQQRRATLDPVGERTERQFQEALQAARGQLDAASKREAAKGQIDEVLDSMAEAVAIDDVSAAGRKFAHLSKTYRLLEPLASLEAKARFDRLEQQLRASKEKTRLDQEAQEQKTLTNIQDRLTRMRALSAAEALSLKEADRELRKAQDLLKNMGPLSRSINRKKIRRELSQAREDLYKKAQQLRDVEAWKRWANADIQVGLIARVEALKASKDVPKIAKELRTIQTEWKEAGTAPADKSEDLWNRYKAVRDELKARCDEFFDKQDEERKANLVKKQALCEQAEALKDETDWNQTADKIKALQAEWKKVGAVPKKHSDAIWKRFRSVCDHFFARRKEHFGELKGERDGNLKTKQALCAQAEAIQNSTDWRDTASELKKLQAEWKAVGPIPRKYSEQLWSRFRKACDHFFDRYKRKDEVEAEESIGKRQTLVAEAAALAEGGPESEDLAAKVTSLWSSWKALGMLPESAAELQIEFESHLGALVEGAPDAFANSELDPAESLKKRERLVKRLESLVEDVTPKTATATPTSELEDLAARLKDALASNTMTGGKGRADSGREWKRASEEVRKLSANWRRAAPVPGDQGRLLGQRFQAAYRDFFAQKPEATRPSR